MPRLLPSSLSLPLDPPPIVTRVLDNARAVNTVRRVGLLRPRVIATLVQALRAWGPTLATGYSAAAVRRPEAPAIVDDDGTITFADFDDLTNRIARVLADRGVGVATPVALMGRNSRWLVGAVCALDKLGATLLYMNTGFAGPQLADVMAREGAALLLHDGEFSDAVSAHAPDAARLVLDTADTADGIPNLVRGVEALAPEPPAGHGKAVILTSGTTGVPKGASRSKEGIGDVNAGTAIIERVPFRVDDVHAIPAPIFHSLGNAALILASLCGHTVVLSRRFDPEAFLASLCEHRVRVVTVVPVMLQRILGLPDDVLDRYRPDRLAIVFCSGSALPGSLALEWMDRFGDNLYNMYGSTEVSAATIATPEDLRAAPGTAGRPLQGVEVAIFDDDGHRIDEPGVTGRIFVGSGLRFEGYTGGQTKESIDGLLSSGDLGYFDGDGRLFVGGREDDMIVSGGENLFPREVEDLLADLDGVAEVAVVGVDDDEFGKRLAAFVVLEDGADLSDTDIRAHVKANLATFKVPRDVTFIDALPRNATGKVLKRDLAAG